MCYIFSYRISFSFLVLDHLLLRDGCVGLIVQGASFIQHRLVIVEQCHSRIKSCEKAKKFAQIGKLMISSQRFHSKFVYSEPVIRSKERKLCLAYSLWTMILNF